MKIQVEVEIFDGDTCKNDSDCCNFLGMCNGEECCYLFRKYITEHNEDGNAVKIKKCKNITERRICINCGYYDDNYCDLYKSEVYSNDTCNSFQYGSWK